MSILVDTDILSRFSPTKARPDTLLAEWLNAHAVEIHLSVVSVWEIEAGCEALRLRGAFARAQAVQVWSDGLLTFFHARTLTIDASTATLGGRLLARAQAGGHDPGIADALIAAQAEQAGMRVATANVVDFTALGARIVDFGRR